MKMCDSDRFFQTSGYNHQTEVITLISVRNTFLMSVSPEKGHIFSPNLSLKLSSYKLRQTMIVQFLIVCCQVAGGGAGPTCSSWIPPENVHSERQQDVRNMLSFRVGQFNRIFSHLFVIWIFFSFWFV